MPDKFYPSIDIDFVKKNIIASGMLEEDGVVIVGQTTTFVVKGPQAIYKRTIYVRELEPGQVCFEQATGLAFRFGFMKPLLEWLEKYRDWKEGAYIVPRRNIQDR